jgi:hypothetical protein
LIAKEFGKLPSEVLHLTGQDESWLAYQVDRATWTWGSWVKARIEEQELRPRTKARNKDLEWQQKYTAKQIEEFIYGPLPDPEKDRQTVRQMTNIDPFAVEPDG